MAGRILSASEALTARLITEVHEPEELDAAADALADRIAKLDPLAVRETKRVMSAERAQHPQIDEQAQAVLFESPEKYRRMTDFLERRRS
jgi:enoyl-CoA hydratase